MRIKEFEPRKLVIFDIDDTLVHTQTKVHVVKDGQVVKSLNSHEFTHYKLQPGEKFDFENFRNAHDFFHNSKPIIPMINQLKNDIATGNRVVMVTARADFDDRELFLDTFRKYGIDMSKVHVYRAGNFVGKSSTEEKKKIIIRDLLNKGQYTKAIMYDDAVPNLESFVELKDEYPHTKFYAWHVSLEGEASEYHRTNESLVYGRNTETFLGEYPSIETKLGEETHPDLVKYDKNFQKQLHRDLDVGQGKGKKTDIDYDSDEKDWSDLTHVQDYTGGSVDTNDYLHRHYRKQAKAKELTTHQAKIQALDRILANHKLPQQIVVYTGLRQSPAEAWETYKADVTKPIRLHLPAYTSTTTKLKVALIHAGEGEIAQVSRARHKPRNKDAPADEWGTQILMMTLPAGLPAASVKKISEFPSENEILLPRGIDIEINPSPTVLKDGDYVWHATVLSHSPVQIASPMQENFADGRHPEDKGDSKRYHVPTKASVSTLRKIAKKGGRKGQLAHWMANMKAGRKKHESVGDHDTDDSSISLDPHRGDYEIRNYHKLDKYLSELADLVEKGKASDQDYGMVAAGILSLKHPYMSRLNRPGSQGKRIHAEHAVLKDFVAKYGKVPEGTVLLTTLSPCTKHLDERDGPSCSSLVERYGIKKVYCGYMDPTQVDDTRKYNLMETSDPKIRARCKAFADTFLDEVKEGMLPSSTFAGSAVGQKAGVPGQLRGNAKQRKDGKQPAFNKLVGGS